MPQYIQKQHREVVTPTSNTMTAAGPVEIGFALDKSSSMSWLQKECVTGFNCLLSEQKKLAVSAKFSLVLFSDELETLYNAESVQAVRSLEPGDYRPEGGTALLDGIGHLMTDIGYRHDSTLTPARVLICILTDGSENSSTEYSLEQIKDLITYRRLQDNWNFIFMTADARGEQFGLSIGIQRANIIQFDADPAGIEKMMHRLGAGMKAFQLGDRQYALRLKDE